MERNAYNKGHFVHLAGKLGRLQTVQVYNVAAGDSLEIELDGIIRLAPLRKEVVSETQVDICVFYIPYRHVYPDWPTKLQRGAGINVADPNFSVSGKTDLSYLTLDYASSSIPRYLVQGYNQIWDRYYRVPSLARDNDELTFPDTDSQDHRDWRLYGRRCARLAHPALDGMRIDGGSATRQPWRDLNDADWTYEAVVSSGFADIDLRALEQVRGKYRSEIERVWFTERYKDVLERIWGTSVNIDADQRPELCMRETFNMSGVDVDGTDDAALGQYIGKTVARCSVNMPRKFFQEHGVVWVMALLRHPFIHVGETHPYKYLLSQSKVDELMADPNLFSAEPPVQYASGDWLAPPWGSITSQPEVKPYGQGYRMQTNRVHKNYADIPGYPFLRQTINNLTEASYYQVGDYDDVFQTSQLAHWQLHARANVVQHSVVPPASDSIYAGA